MHVAADVNIGLHASLHFPGVLWSLKVTCLQKISCVQVLASPCQIGTSIKILLRYMYYLEQATSIAISQQLSIGEAFHRQMHPCYSQPMLHLSYLHGVLLSSLGSPPPTPAPQVGWLLRLRGRLLML